MSAAEDYVKDLISLEWETGTFQMWKKVVQTLQALNLESGIDKRRIEDKLIPVLSKLIEPEILYSLWIKVLSLNVETGSSEGASLLKGHRLIANLFQTNLPVCFHHQAYVTAVLRALTEVIRDTVDINPYTVEGVVDSLTDSNVSIFLEELTLGEKNGGVISLLCGLMNPIWLLNAAKTVLKKLVRLNNSESVNTKTALRELVRGAVDRGVTAHEVVDALVLAHTSKRHIIPRRIYSEIASCIVETVPNAAMAELLDATLFVWSDKLFISRADVPKMTYLTEVVVAALAQCNRRQLSVTGSRSLPVELVLSMGISNYLEVDNISIRVHGMRAAQCYAQLIGEPLRFAELESFDVEEKRRENQNAVIADAPSSSSGTAQSKSAAKSNPAGAKGAPLMNDKSSAHTHTSVGYDTDSSEELVGYDDIEEDDHLTGVYDYKDKLLNTNYLRDCLQSKRILISV